MQPRPRLTTFYFQLLNGRKLSEAEEVLKKVKEGLDGSEWNKGYLNAMEGLLLAARSDDDRYLYLKRVKLGTQTLREVKAKLRRCVGETGLLNPEFDSGYFRCWVDYLKTLEDYRVKVKGANPIKPLEAYRKGSKP